MKDLLETLDAWTAHGDAVAVATVVETRRSTPRPAGTKMLVNARGDVAGGVSGGCVEGAVVSAAMEVLERGGPRLLEFGFADERAWEVGLPCGGEIAVLVERLDAPAQRAFFAGAGAGRRAALITRLDDGAKLLVDADGAVEGTLGDGALDRAAVAHADALMWAPGSERREALGVPLFVDVVFPAPRLVVFGAVDFAEALCAVAQSVGWRPYLVDPRRQFADPGRFPHATEVIAQWPAEALARLGGIDRATSVAVLSHDPKLDDAALELALRSDAPFVGAIGSRRAQADRRERLGARGLSERELDRLHAPIGLDLGAMTGPETALSIMAEVVAVHRGRSGRPLRETAGRIHGAVAA